MVYVVPTSEMEIKMGKHVDISGRVYLPYLTEWKHVSIIIIAMLNVLKTEASFLFVDLIQSSYCAPV